MRNHNNGKRAALIAITLLLMVITSCATSGRNSNLSGPSLSTHIKNENYAAAKKQLDYLYSGYPKSHRAEIVFLGRITGVIQLDPATREKQLNRFFELYGKSTSGQFLEAVYFFWKGVETRGTAYADDTEKEKMVGMKDNFANSVSRFQAVLEKDPSSYLAHSYIGAMFSYQSGHEAAEREFRNALAINPASFDVWRSFINYKLPRWSGSYEEMEVLLVEMKAYEGRNQRLRNLQGLVLVDKADWYARNGQLDLAEDFIFKAWEFAPYKLYGQTLDFVYQKVGKSGDKVSACRMARKIHKLVPDIQRFLKDSQDCDVAGL